MLSTSVRPSELPEHALLRTYQANGAYTDCFATDMSGAISHESFVAAFYTTWIFKLERAILTWIVAKPSTDLQAAQLASGATNEFAAWHVEKRGPDQLLVSDFQHRTKSWLMVAPITLESGTGTRLYFGSAVVPVIHPTTGEREMGRAFRVLLGFHKLYSVILLRAARSRLSRQNLQGHP